ncbi:MAG: hypothetical protein M3P97_01495 [Actinomycetota bacterium]|nr:hypothetical protein [Actinomycetota bacterium]
MLDEDELGKVAVIDHGAVEGDEGAADLQGSRRVVSAEQQPDPRCRSRRATSRYRRLLA